MRSTPSSLGWRLSLAACAHCLIVWAEACHKPLAVSHTSNVHSTCSSYCGCFELSSLWRIVTQRNWSEMEKSMLTETDASNTVVSVAVLSRLLMCRTKCKQVICMPLVCLLCFVSPVASDLVDARGCFGLQRTAMTLVDLLERTQEGEIVMIVSSWSAVEKM
jgi:hypothetical protein